MDSNSQAKLMFQNFRSFHNLESSLQKEISKEWFSLLDVIYACKRWIWCYKAIKNIFGSDILCNRDLSISSKFLLLFCLNVVIHMEAVLYTQVNLTQSGVFTWWFIQRFLDQPSRCAKSSGLLYAFHDLHSCGQVMVFQTTDAINTGLQSFSLSQVESSDVCLDPPHLFASFLQFYLPNIFLRNKLICLSDINIVRNEGDVTLRTKWGKIGSCSR